MSSIHVDELVTADELAEKWKVKKGWIYDQVQDGKLKCVRLGRQVRFRPADLVAFLGDQED